MKTDFIQLAQSDQEHIGRKFWQYAKKITSGMYVADDEVYPALALIAKTP